MHSLGSWRRVVSGERVHPSIRLKSMNAKFYKFYGYGYGGVSGKVNYRMEYATINLTELRPLDDASLAYLVDLRGIVVLNRKV